jgi:hypothetical protein
MNELEPYVLVWNVRSLNAELFLSVKISGHCRFGFKVLTVGDISE